MYLAHALAKWTRGLWSALLVLAAKWAESLKTNAAKGLKQLYRGLGWSQTLLGKHVIKWTFLLKICQNHVYHISPECLSCSIKGQVQQETWLFHQSTKKLMSWNGFSNFSTDDLDPSNSIYNSKLCLYASYWYTKIHCNRSILTQVNCN